MWKGTAEILNARPAKHEHESEKHAELAITLPQCCAMASNPVFPVKP
jgi:hypothetical protein